MAGKGFTTSKIVHVISFKLLCLQAILPATQQYLFVHFTDKRSIQPITAKVIKYRLSCL